MSNRILTERVRATALNMGMDLVGFAPVERWKNAPYLLSPQAILPEARTVVVCGFHITDTWAEMGGEPEPQDRSPGGWMDQNGLLDRVAYRIARLLHDAGGKAGTSRRMIFAASEKPVQRFASPRAAPGTTQTVGPAAGGRPSSGRGGGG